MTSEMKVIRLLLIIGLCAGMFPACGVKKVPLPPGYKMPPPIESLDYRILDGTVILSWRLPDNVEKKRKYSRAAYYRLFRSTTASSRPKCDTCPVVFKKIAEVSVTTKEYVWKKDEPVTYREPLKPGFRYMYRVAACSADDDQGQLSNIVEFVYE